MSNLLTNSEISATYVSSVAIDYIFDTTDGTSVITNYPSAVS